MTKQFQTHKLSIWIDAPSDNSKI